MIAGDEKTEGRSGDESEERAGGGIRKVALVNGNVGRLLRGGSCQLPKGCYPKYTLVTHKAILGSTPGPYCEADIGVRLSRSRGRGFGLYKERQKVV